MMASLFYLTVAFILGVAFGRLASPCLFWGFILTIFLGLVALTRSFLRWPALLLGFFSLGLLSYTASERTLKHRLSETQKALGEARCTVSGVVCWKEKSSDDRWHIEMEPKQVVCGSSPVRWPFHVVLKGPGPGPNLLPGDLVTVKGRWRPQVAHRSSGLVALSMDVGALVHVSISHAAVRMKGRASPGPLLLFRRLAAWVRARSERALEAIPSGRPRQVIWAMLLGPSSGVDHATKLTFRRLGISHILVISGLHLTLIAALLFGGLCFFLLRTRGVADRIPARRVAALLTVPLLWLYLGLVSSSPSTLRAGIMATCVLLSCASSRFSGMGAGLALAALLSLLWQPGWLFRPGFQLSYVAVLSLVWASQRKKEKDRLEPERTFVTRALAYSRSLIVATAAATIGTSALAAYHFGQVAPAALMANLFMVPLFCLLILPCSFVGLAAGIFLPTASRIIFAPTAWIISSSLRGLDLAAAWVPWIDGIGGIAAVQALGFYLLLWALMGWKRTVWNLRGERLWARIAFVLLGLCIMLFLRPAQMGKEDLEVTFLDTGSGDSILIRAPGNKTVLVDGGGPFQRGRDAGLAVVLPYLRRHGIRSIDLMVLTHPHADHYAGLFSILGKVKVKTLWVNGEQDKELRNLGLLKRARKLEVEVEAPSDKSFGKVRLEVIHPRPGWKVEPYPFFSVNDNSLVLRLVHPKGRVLLTGDIRQQAEKLLAGRPEAIRAEILKVPHHGWSGSSTFGFIRAVRPCLAVFTGEGNAPGFQQVMRRYESIGSKAAGTTGKGNIAVRFTESGILVRMGKDARFRKLTCEDR